MQTDPFTCGTAFAAPQGGNVQGELFRGPEAPDFRNFRLAGLLTT